MSWKQLLWDAFVLVYIVVVLMAWEGRPQHKQVLDIVMCGMLIIFRIGDHWEYYRNKKRFY